jgi:oligopeptide/dipeptide ABC transporter ATP-binding protein
VIVKGEQADERELVVEDLSVEIGRGPASVHAVSGVGFSLAHGEHLGIVGESGSGKSMTAAAILGVLPLHARTTGGRVLFGGRDLLLLSEKEMESVRGRDISLVFQNAKGSLNPVFPIGTQIASVYRRHNGGSRRDAHARAVEMLGLLGIENPQRVARSAPHELSGGMAQRALLAMGLICEPRIVVADEPTTGLDLTIQAQVKNVLAERLAGSGSTLVLISHDIGVVASLCDLLLVMYGGEVCESSTTAAVLSEPKHPYTMGLLAAFRAVDRPAYIPGSADVRRGAMCGCVFAARCPRAETLCREVKPVLRMLSEGHAVACHFAEEN